MTTDSPLRTGTALCLTVGTGYALCTLVFRIWPESAATFMNALFHGLDFRKLQDGASLFTFGSFVYALVVMMAWAFGLGLVYGWARSLLGHGNRERASV